MDIQEKLRDELFRVYEIRQRLEDEDQIEVLTMLRAWNDVIFTLVENNRRLREAYRDLARDWNAQVQAFNAMAHHYRPGRPLRASEAQQTTILRLRKHGASLRAIARQVGLPLHAVVTIVEKGAPTPTTRQLSRVTPIREAHDLPRAIRVMIRDLNSPLDNQKRRRIRRSQSGSPNGSPNGSPSGTR
jgi:hypothetical protein